MSDTSSIKPTWIDTLKLEFAQLNLQMLGALALYGIIACVIGVLIKRYLGHFIIALLASVIVLWFLQYIDAITLDLAKIKLAFGIDPNAQVQDVVRGWVIWMQEHPLHALVLALGLLLGLALG